MKASQGHTQYGDYTLVFPRQSIDPKADRRNKVYGADAWTPTAANAIVEREVNYEARRAAEQKIAQLAEPGGGWYLLPRQRHQRPRGEVSTMDEAELAKRFPETTQCGPHILQSKGKTSSRC